MNYEDWIDRQEWTFAKTYAKSAPHEYVVKTRLSIDDQEVFEEFARHIRREGYQAEFAGRTYTYLDVGEHKYWTMGDPIPETIILNRRKKR